MVGGLAASLAGYAQIQIGLQGAGTGHAGGWLDGITEQAVIIEPPDNDILALCSWPHVEIICVHP